MRILLIEDYLPCAEGFLSLMEEYLPDATVTHCATLQDATGALQEDAPYNIIVLDLSLPDAKGTEGLCRLQALLRETTDTPIVVYTAYPAYQHACLDEGAAAFVVKANIDGKDLAALLERLATTR